MDGAAWRARWKAERSSASPSPTYMENSDAPASDTTCAPDAVAAARTSVVLQHPAAHGIFCSAWIEVSDWDRNKLKVLVGSGHSTAPCQGCGVCCGRRYSRSFMLLWLLKSPTTCAGGAARIVLVIDSQERRANTLWGRVRVRVRIPNDCTAYLGVRAAGRRAEG